VVLLAFAGVVTRAQPARAQVPSPAAGNTPQVETRNAESTRQIEAPALLEFVEAWYPPEALARRLEARVVLALVIDAQGAVTEANVTEPAGYGFDEAALDAVRRFRFVPAKRAGQPMASRILYAYEFRLPAEASVTPAVTPMPLPKAPRAPAIAPASRPTARPADESVEVTVRGQSTAQRVRESAQAVTVVETEDARRESADLGELLARTQGVGVQRAGGLGSESRFSLNGLDDDQIRFFVDGVPLELMGYPFGFENVPVNFVERIDVYQGVVPIRLGADALGGAVELITERNVAGTHAAGSFQAGSFGTVRATVGARHLHESTGWFVSGEGFVDSAKNDYYVDVEVPNEQGELSVVRVPRFHDGYRAAGANVEAGFVRRKWANRLLLRGFVTDFEKELQHNVLMTVPYGEVRYGGASRGLTARYENTFGPLGVTAIAGFARNRWDYVDVADCVYDWFGRCGLTRRDAGERGDARDQSLWDDTIYARVQGQWRFSPEHTLRVALSPTSFGRTGQERRLPDPDARDPLTARRDLVSAVDAVDYELDLFEDRLENVAFFKHYLQLLRAERSLPGNVFERLSRSTSEFGAGDALRLRFAPFLYAKASYEWAANLPRPDQIFGNGSQIVDNLELLPERSHNANLSLSFALPDTRAGGFDANVNLFLRDVENLIVLLGSDLVFSYQNVFGARITGIEASTAWSSAGEHVELGGNVTYLDMRNTSRRGTFGEFEGDRIPNRPYFSANANLRGRLREVAARGDDLSAVWYSRYVHDFFRTWEGFGRPDLKATIASQLTHTAAVTYLVEGDPLELSFTGEVQNVTDAKVFDFFGIQRPGRAFYFKTTAEF
jgi:vitamin B12 transporter